MVGADAPSWERYPSGKIPQSWPGAQEDRERRKCVEDVKRKRMSPVAATATRNGMVVGEGGRGVEIAKRNAQSSERGLRRAVKGR